MRFFALIALAGAAAAHPEIVKRQTASAAPSATVDSSEASIYGVLLTALPSSIIAQASDPARLSSEIAAQFETETPSWFSSLPPDVQTYLLAQGSSATTVTSTGPVASGSSGMPGTTNSTTMHSATLTSDSTTSTPTGGASLPTGIIGGGVAGLVGLVGVLAL